MKTTVLALLFAALATLAAPAADLFSRNFASGAYEPDGLLLWTGPTQDGWGRIAEGPVPESLRPPDQALVFTTGSAAPKGCAPTLTAKVPASADAAKVRRFHLRFLVPVTGDYRVDIHFGGNWDSNAAILVLENGGVSVWNPVKGFKVGLYNVEKWDDLVVAFDPAKKTYTVVLNGTPVSSDLPWNDPKLAAVGDIVIVGNIEKTLADGAPYLYLAELGISEE